MKAIKALLAVSILSAAGVASGAVVPVTATLNSQTPPTGTQTLSGDTSFYGTIDVDFTTGALFSLSLTTNGSYTSTSDLGPAVTFYSGSTWSASLGSGITPTAATPSDSGLVVTYEWGAATSDSNLAGTFSALTAPTCNGHAFCSFAMAGSPAWDAATLTINLDNSLNVLSVLLETSEVGIAGTAISQYSLALAPEVPLPAAAWLFGSGLIGLAGVVRRRRAAA